MAERRKRKKRPDPSPETVARLHRLYEAKQQADVDLEKAKNELYIAAAEASDVERVTREQIAEALGVGGSTVQGWVDHGRRLRASPE